MSLWAIALFFFVYIAMAFGITRVRAAFGPPYHEVVFVNPRQFMTVVLGSRVIGGANLTIMSFLYPFTRCHRSHPMPNQLEALKIAQQGDMLNRRLMWAMMSAIGIGAFATFWIYLDIAYKYGASAKCYGWLSGIGWETFNPLQSWLSYPQNTDRIAIMFMGGNVLFVLFLMAMFASLSSLLRKLPSPIYMVAVSSRRICAFRRRLVWFLVDRNFPIW
jgi:hypothetical protein